MRQAAMNAWVAITTYSVDTGSSSTGAFYSYSPRASSDRALGIPIHRADPNPATSTLCRLGGYLLNLSMSHS